MEIIKIFSSHPTNDVAVAEAHFLTDCSSLYATGVRRIQSVLRRIGGRGHFRKPHAHTSRLYSPVFQRLPIIDIPGHDYATFLFPYVYVIYAHYYNQKRPEPTKLKVRLAWFCF